MENNMNSIHQQSESPIPCSNGCGFFGTAATMNLCSKCYRDHRLTQDQAHSAMAAVEKSLMTSSPQPLALAVEPQLTVAEPSSVPADVAAPEKKARNKCGSCNKKVGVMGFVCRCGATFCGSHRYPEEHGCVFDFKGAGKDAIARANPVVKADKVDRF